jgi:hypothetical protein
MIATENEFRVPVFTSLRSYRPGWTRAGMPIGQAVVGPSRRLVNGPGGAAPAVPAAALAATQQSLPRRRGAGAAGAGCRSVAGARHA